MVRHRHSHRRRTTPPTLVPVSLSDGLVIVLEGGIAVGKSTAARALHTLLTSLGHTVTLMTEKINQDLLALYLGDMQRYAFPFQSIVACERVQLYKEAQRLAELGHVVLIDRSLIGDLAFATMQMEKGFFSASEWAVYHSLIGLSTTNKQQVAREFMRDAVILFFDTKPAEAFRRMQGRGIASELAAYKPGYFADLHAAYETAIGRCAKYERIDWNRGRVVDDATCIELLSGVPALRHLVAKQQ